MWKSHACDRTSASVEFKAHSIVDFVIPEGDVVLIESVPFLQLDLPVVSAGLRANKLLQIADRVIGTTLDTDFPSQAIISYNLD